ncbi:MAG TPA: hypothetical protein VKP60_15995 [Magnetospirillaceae bacterium]|nr:hypothetical protein [Magnetospirillaceae bacterium]
MYQNGHKPLLTRLGARLGLLALALQLVLSFAHIHPLPGSVTALSAPAGSTSPDLPATGDDCAICASIANFAALDLPRQAAVIPPGSAVEILAPVSATGEHRAPPILHFSSRAPPAA